MPTGVLAVAVCACAIGATTAPAEAWSLAWIDAWSNRDAAWFAAHAVDLEKESSHLALGGMINDWVVAACSLRADSAVDVSVKLDGDTPFLSASDLKVVGEAAGPPREGQRTWWLDPLFANPSSLGDLSSYIHNWAAIRDFPTVHLDPERPVVLWLTIRTHGLEAGETSGKILAVDGGQELHSLTLSLRVHPVELPVENPIIGNAWIPCGGSKEIAQTVKDYGFFVAGYGDWEMEHALGYRFHRFVLPGRGRGIGGGTPETVTNEEILAALKPIRDTVDRLELGPDAWGLEIYDEPVDQSSHEVARWMARIRQAWPEVRFWANPGWGGTAQTDMTVLGTVVVLAPYVDLWCPYFEGMIRGGTLDAMKATGKPVWYYWITQVWDRPPAGGRATPWIAWKYDLDGWGFYALLNTQGDVDPWQDNVYQHMYPGNTVSLWMEGLQQGVHDYKRLHALAGRGMAPDKLQPLASTILFPGHDAPWSDIPPEVYAGVRQQLDALLLATGKRGIPDAP